MTRNTPAPKAITATSSPSRKPATKQAGKSVAPKASAPAAKRFSSTAPPPAGLSPSPAAKGSKIAQLEASLRPAPGVSLEKMMALTGWRAHSVRAAISGLRKKRGLEVTCVDSGQPGKRVYRIVEGGAGMRKFVELSDEQFMAALNSQERPALARCWIEAFASQVPHNAQIAMLRRRSAWQGQMRADPKWPGEANYMELLRSGRAEL